jgi:hypothetical protein
MRASCEEAASRVMVGSTRRIPPPQRPARSTSAHPLLNSRQGQAQSTPLLNGWQAQAWSTPSSMAGKLKLGPRPPQWSKRSSSVQHPPPVAESLGLRPPGMPSWWR